MDVDKDLDLKINPYDPVPGYLTDLKLLQPRSVSKSASMPGLEDDPSHEAMPTRSSDETESSSSSCSCSESEDEELAEPEGSKDDQDEINEDAYTEDDPQYLLQLATEYKGTKGTREDMARVEETYHATTDTLEETLLKGEAMESSPRTETVLLANPGDTPATGVNLGISATETATAVVSISNLDMPTEAEFLGDNTDVDMEETPDSFNALSHQTPALQDIKEKKSPSAIDRNPKKTRGKHSSKGKKRRH